MSKEFATQNFSSSSRLSQHRDGRGVFSDLAHPAAVHRRVQLPFRRPQKCQCQPSGSRRSCDWKWSRAIGGNSESPDLAENQSIKNLERTNLKLHRAAPRRCSHCGWISSTRCKTLLRGRRSLPSSWTEEILWDFWYTTSTFKNEP